MEAKRFVNDHCSTKSIEIYRMILMMTEDQRKQYYANDSKSFHTHSQEYHSRSIKSRKSNNKWDDIILMGNDQMSGTMDIVIKFVPLYGSKGVENEESPRIAKRHVTRREKSLKTKDHSCWSYIVVTSSCYLLCLQNVDSAIAMARKKHDKRVLGAFDYVYNMLSTKLAGWNLIYRFQTSILSNNVWCKFYGEQWCSWKSNNKTVQRDAWSPTLTFNSSLIGRNQIS